MITQKRTTIFALAALVFAGQSSFANDTADQKPAGEIVQSKVAESVTPDNPALRGRRDVRDLKTLDQQD